jgi:type II secretory pathway pseudopilin PulG
VSRLSDLSTTARLRRHRAGDPRPPGGGPRPRTPGRRSWPARAVERRRAAQAGHDTDHEAGFTLIELAIVLVVLPLIMGAVAVAILVTLQDQAGVSTRLSDSVDSQVTSAFYVRDVQSAQYVTTATTPGAPPWTPAYGAPTCGSGKSFVLGLAWSAAGPGSPEVVASYWTSQLGSGTGSAAGSTLTASSPVFSSSDIGEGVVQTNGSSIPTGTTIKSVLSRTAVTLSIPQSRSATGTGITFVVGPSLVRYLCKSGSTESMTTSHDFFSPFTHAVVSCVSGHTKPTCTTPTPSHPKTAGHGWVPTFAVSSVTLAVTEPAGKYDYNVSASPRLSNAKGSPFGNCTGTECFSRIPTLLLLGGFHVITEHSTHTSITVVGTAVLNTGYLKMTSGSIFTVTTKTPAKGRILSTLTPPTLVCTTTGAQCSTPPSATVTPWPPVHIPAPVADPLRGLADPGPATVQPCPGGNGSVTGAITLQPGQYQHCTLHVKSGGAVTLSAGLYEFDTGITLTGGGSLDGTSGVLIYLPCNKAVNGNNVDTWATRCTEQVRVHNSTISAKRIVSGPYASLWFWQNKGDAQPFTLGGVKNSMRAVGIMYDPGAPVTLSGLGTSTTPLGAIVAANLSVSNSNIKVIG